MPSRWRTSGWIPHLADVSDELLAFAAWQANIRSVSFPLIHLDRDPLEATYDFIVAADVFEHLPAPTQTLTLLCEHRKDGGLLFIHVATVAFIDLPRHISFWGEQLVIEEGFQEIFKWGDLSVLLRKTGRVRARGTPPRYFQPELASRHWFFPTSSPAQWWAQTSKRLAASRMAAAPRRRSGPGD